MKWYHLTSKIHRDNVDLRNYETEIRNAVHKVRSDVTVIVKENAFCILPPLTSKRELIAISMDLRASSMCDFTFYRPSLFTGQEESYEITEEELNDNN